jgi:hypothetical protein
MRSAVLSPPGAIGVGLSCAVHALTIGSVICSAYGFGIPLNPIVAGLIVPVAILVSSLPISIGGWGVREASLSFGLTMFGIAPEDGTLLGLTLGLSQLAASLPGGIAILLLDRAEPHGGPAPRLFG